MIEKLLQELIEAIKENTETLKSKNKITEVKEQDISIKKAEEKKIAKKLEETKEVNELEQEIQKVEEDKKLSVSDAKLHKQAKDLVLEIYADLSDELFESVEADLEAIFQEQGMVEINDIPSNVSKLVKELKSLVERVEKLKEEKEEIISIEDFKNALVSFTDPDSDEYEDNVAMLKKVTSKYNVAKASLVPENKRKQFLEDLGI